MSHRTNTRMDALAIMLSGDSPYPDQYMYSENTFYALLTGQTCRQDDHFVVEAFERGIPVYVFQRNRGGKGFTHCGLSTSHAVVSETGADVMEARVYCPSVGATQGRGDGRLAWCNGALSSIPNMVVSDESKVGRCFVPMKYIE